MRNLAEATILVTGATDGLGKRVASALAGEGATLLLHGRNRERLQATMEEVSEQTGSEKLRYYLADFLLTRLLLPLLEYSAPSRIVNVASAGQSPVDFSNLMLEQGYDAMKAYSQSKLAQVMFTFELAERLADTGVSVNALHPASLMETKMVEETFGYTMSTVEEGADATVHLAASPELEGVTGRYFDGKREARADGQAYDEEARQTLWELSEQLCGRLLEEPF